MRRSPGSHGKIDEYIALEGLRAEHARGRRQGRERPDRVRLARRCRSSPARSAPRGPTTTSGRSSRKVHAAGMYLIGRVVVFEDPTLSAARPDLALLRPDGSRWLNNGGLGWVNPYDQRVWRYVVGVGEAAAKAGFDEIQFDYVRFPSDGDVSQIVYRHKAGRAEGRRRSRGSSATRRRRCTRSACASRPTCSGSRRRTTSASARCRSGSPKYVDAIYPMVYPSHFSPGEYGIPDPDAYPGRTVARALLRLPPAGEGHEDRADPVAPGLLARAPVRADRGHRPDRRGAAAARARVHALEPGGRVHPGGARRASDSRPRLRRRRSSLVAPGRARGLVRADRRAAAARRTGRSSSAWARRSLAVARVDRRQLRLLGRCCRGGRSTVRVSRYAYGTAAGDGDASGTCSACRARRRRERCGRRSDGALGATVGTLARVASRARPASTWRISSPGAAPPGTRGRASPPPRR